MTKQLKQKSEFQTEAAVLNREIASAEPPPEPGDIPRLSKEELLKRSTAYLDIVCGN